MSDCIKTALDWIMVNITDTVIAFFIGGAIGSIITSHFNKQSEKTMKDAYRIGTERLTAELDHVAADRDEYKRAFFTDYRALRSSNDKHYSTSVSDNEHLNLPDSDNTTPSPPNQE